MFARGKESDSETSTGYVGPSVRLRGCIIGRSADLRRGARCEEGVVLGDDCFVGAKRKSGERAPSCLVVVRSERARPLIGRSLGPESTSAPSAADDPCSPQPAGERVTDSVGEPASVWKTTQ